MVPKIFFPFKDLYIQHTLWSWCTENREWGKQDGFVFDGSVLPWLLLAIMFSGNRHIKVMWSGWFTITKARQFKGCIQLWLEVLKNRNISGSAHFSSLGRLC